MLANVNGPSVWDEILDVVGRHWLPVVAGGAVRDFLLRLAPKDIDVFVPASDENDFESIIKFLNPSLSKGDIIYIKGRVDPEEALAMEYDEATDFIGVWEGEILGHPVNIIGRQSLQGGPVTLVNTFDFNVVKCFYENGLIETTPEASSDLNKRQATLAHERTFSQSINRFRRFNKRHPGLLALVVPDEFIPAEGRKQAFEGFALDDCPFRIDVV